ncbi:MAG: hypothetical protein HC822_00615 [Oscillochloris sp.]|nr:hypothetical protein [Oscillochloris sp.]
MPHLRRLRRPAEPTAAQPAEPTAAQPAPAEPTTAPAAAEMSDAPYRIGIFSDITTTNYWSYLGPNGTQWNSYILNPQRIALYALSDRRFEIIPQLALEMPTRPLAKEGDFWVSEITLRDNATWSDGTPVTARDFAFTANTVVEMELPGNWGSIFDWNFLDRVEAPDEYTVKLYYSQEPGLAVHEWGALQGPIMQEAYWAPIVADARVAVGALDPLPEGASAEDQTAYEERLTEAMNILYNYEPADEPTAAGWMQGSREPGAFIENIANPSFFQNGAAVSVFANGAYVEQGNNYEIGIGEPVSEMIADYVIGPHSESTVYTVYGSQDAAILALKNGEIDFILNPLGLQAAYAIKLRISRGSPLSRTRSTAIAT